MPSPEALVQAQVDAYNAQDMDAFLARFDPAAEFIRWGGGVEHRGHAAFRERYGELWRRAPALKARILNRIVMGRFVVDHEQLLNHPDGDRPPLVVIYETEGDRIRRFWVLTGSA